MTVAHPGAQIDVEPGTYPEQVMLTKRLTIKGVRSPLVDAQGHGRGIVVAGAGAARSVVEDLVVEHATYEGILVLGTTGVTIADNVVRNNDRGFFARHLTGECTTNGKPPPWAVQLADERAGGCGEAVHLASSSGSRVIGNLVTGNTGGIYLTDESGPAAHNLIADNRVLGNVWDCGITLASHSHRAVSADGRLTHAGGVYDNTIRANVSNGNGVRLSGAGILVAAAFSGGAAYGNLIIANTVNDNGLPGVALHSHDPRQDLNGNIIRDNTVGRNAIGAANTGPGDGDAGIHQTAGILVWSAFRRITALEVTGNRISGNHFGIWTQLTPPVSQAANHFTGVQVPLSQH